MSSFIWQFFLMIQFHWIFITLHGYSATGSYMVISEEEETWLNASRICKTTYGGKLISSVEGSRQKMECLSNYIPNAEFWSRNGLILSPFLSHEGCFRIVNDTMIQRKKFNSAKSVGECYVYCQNRTDYFGIKNDTCFCIFNNEIHIETLLKSNRSGCDNTCKDDSTSDNLEFCGGKTALNLYRQIPMIRNQGDGKCATIVCSTSDYHLSAQKCDSNSYYVCGGENYRNEQPVVKFSIASDLCNKKYKEYLSPSLTHLCNNRQSQAGLMYWLDVRRYWSPTTDIRSHTSGNKFKCGYFKSGISATMLFEGDCINSQRKKKFVCETGSIPTQDKGNAILCSVESRDTSTMDTTTTLQSTKSDSRMSTSVSDESRENISLTYTLDTLITTEGYINRISMNTSQSGHSSAVIGAVVGVLVTTCLVAAITIFLVLRRRKVIQRERSKSSEMIESQESKNNFKLEEKQNALQSYEIDQESRHYFQLEANPKHNIDVGSPPQEHLQSEDEYNEADDTVYHETSNDVYDHLNERRKKTTDNEDMYHIANGFQSDNDEYQHIHSLKGVTNRESSSDYARFNEDQYSAIQREK